MNKDNMKNEFYVSLNSETQTVINFLRRSNVSMKPEFMNELIALLSDFCFLKEEDKNLTPKILLGHNISSKIFTKIFPKFEMIVFYRNDHYSNINLYAKIKPLLPFCNKDWFIYVNIDIHNDSIEFGIMKSYLIFESLSMDELLFSIPSDILYNQYGISYFQILKNDSRSIKLFSSNGEKCEINFALVKKVKDNEENYRDIFIDDIIGDYKGNNVIRKSLEKLIDSFKSRLHGTICLVVNPNSNVSSLNLSDGIYFEKPIDLMSALVTISEINNEISSDIKVLLQKVYDTYDLLYEMLDFDGITIITSDFKILGYNAFIKSETLARNNVAGGARRRAAETLLNSGNENYVGIYFQSQDGDYFYKRSIKK